MRTMRGHNLLIGLAFLVGCLAASSDAGQAEPTYRQLEIGGRLVQWPTTAGYGAITLTYGIAVREIKNPEAVNCGAMRPPERLLARSELNREGFREAMRRAFSRWSGVARIDFQEALPGQIPNIVIGEQGKPTGIAFTNLSFSNEHSETTQFISSSTICLNPERRWKLGRDGDLSVFDVEQVIAHEIGHAIGLDHPGARGQLMSFRYTESISGLTVGDLLGAIAIYGTKVRQADPISRNRAAER